MIRYKGTALSSNINVSSPRTTPYKLSNPLKAFNDLDVCGQRNKLFFNEAFLDDHGIDTMHYTFRLNNHFQGVARHMDGQHFIFSSSNTFDDTACLFVFKVESYLKHTETNEFRRKFIRSNTIIPSDDVKTDNIESIFHFTGPYWHAGGISLLGDILVCPLENKSLKKRSKINFINFRDPSNPKLYKTEVSRDFAAGCATMTRLNNEHFLLAVWTEDGGEKLDFYLSKSKNISNGFSDAVTVPFESFKNKTPGIIPRFQAMQFLQDSNGDKIYIVGTDRGKVPLANDEYRYPNRRFLLRIEANPATTRVNDPVIAIPKVTIFSHREMPYGGESYDFNSVGGHYVFDDKLYMYGGSPFRVSSNANLRLTEFAPAIGSQGQCLHLKDAVVELYTENEYKGRCLVLQIDRVNTLANYRSIKGVKKKHFNDCIKSIRYKLPKGILFRLYEDSDFNRDDESKNHLDLKGNGKLKRIPKLSDKNITGLKYKRSFRNKISSSKLLS